MSTIGEALIAEARPHLLRCKIAKHLNMPYDPSSVESIVNLALEVAKQSPSLSLEVLGYRFESIKSETFDKIFRYILEKGNDLRPLYESLYRR